MSASLKKRIEEARAADVPGATCSLERCSCPSCKVTEFLLRVALNRRGVSPLQTSRVTIRANDFAGGAHPYVATVRVDGVEVYRIHDRPDEVFAEDVITDIIAALKRRSA